MAAAVYAQQQAHASLLQQQQQQGACKLGSPSGGSAGSGGGPPSAEPRAPSLVRPGKDGASADSPGGTPTSPLSKQRGAAERRRSARQPKRPAAGQAAAPPARRAKQQQQPAASDGDGTHGSHASGTQAGAQQQPQGLSPLALQLGAGTAAAGMRAAFPIDLPDLDDGLGDLDDCEHSMCLCFSLLGALLPLPVAAALLGCHALRARGAVHAVLCTCSHVCLCQHRTCRQCLLSPAASPCLLTPSLTPAALPLRSAWA